MPLPSVAFDCRADLEGVAAVAEEGGWRLLLVVVWAGVEGAEWIIYEYSCSLPCSTKQKMAPRRETPPIQKWREERKGGNGGRRRIGGVREE